MTAEQELKETKRLLRKVIDDYDRADDHDQINELPGLKESVSEADTFLLINGEG